MAISSFYNSITSGSCSLLSAVAITWPDPTLALSRRYTWQDPSETVSLVD